VWSGAAATAQQVKVKNKVKNKEQGQEPPTLRAAQHTAESDDETARMTSDRGGTRQGLNPVTHARDRG